MTKYHLKKDGTPGACGAQPGNCPRGADSEHYGTKDDAQAAYEKTMETQLLSRFEKSPGLSSTDGRFKEEVARKRRIEDAILQADPHKTVIEANYRDLERTWDGTTKRGYYVHPEFRAALPDNDDFAAYVELVQLDDRLSETEKESSYVHYEKKKGLFTYSWIEDSTRRHDTGYD